MNGREWAQYLGSLVVGEAVALPVTTEAEGCIRRIRLVPRLTPHARRAAKHIDIPVSERDPFVFWRNNVLEGRKARTLREFVVIAEQLPPAALISNLTL